MTKTRVFDCTTGENEEAIFEAARAVERGELVVFPTETVYGIACAVSKESVGRLNSLKDRDPSKHYTLHIEDPQKTGQYVPEISDLGKRLIRRGWPGPLTLVFEIDQRQREMQRDFPDAEVFELLYASDSLGIRCVSHPVGGALLRECGVEVFAPSANPGGKQPAVNAEMAKDYLEGSVYGIVDGGECEYKQSSTVVRVHGTGVEVLREGVYSQEEVLDMAAKHVLFVCTGNTCRSPMAEYLCKHYLCEKFDCNVDELVEKGYKIKSCGIAGFAGSPVSPESVEICLRYGMDASGHRSIALTEALVEWADSIYVMTEEHLRGVEQISGSFEKAELLGSGNIPDPIGSGLEVYRKCAEVILDSIETKFSETSS